MYLLLGDRSSAHEAVLSRRTPQQRFSSNPSAGLLATPPSSAAFSPYSRRDSVTSWAATSLSEASSVSYSPQQPSTPVRKRDGHDEFVMIGNLDLRDGNLDRHFKTPSCSEFAHDFQYPAEWPLETPADIYHRPSLQQTFDVEADHWQPAADLLQQYAFSKNEPPQPLPHSIPHQTPWPVLQGFQDADLFCGLQSASDPHPSLASSVDMTSSTSFRSLTDVHQTGFGIAQPTVVPSQTFMEVDPDATSHSAIYSDGMNSSFPSTGITPNGYNSEELYSSDESPEKIAEEPDPDWVRVRREPDYIRVSRIRETSTGAKGVKKGRKTKTGGHRKSKRKNEAALVVGPKFDIKIEAETYYKAMEKRDGKIVTNIDKNVCGFELTPGEFCERAFTRMEHLNRHRYIHTHERPYVCAVLDCIVTKGKREGERKAFGRADNRLAHYVTHLKRKTGSRNSYVGFDELCERIRHAENPEEAKKTIAKLEKGLKEGKFNTEDSTS